MPGVRAPPPCAPLAAAPTTQDNVLLKSDVTQPAGFMPKVRA